MTTRAALHAALRGRRAVVLGASGFLGRWVARALSEVDAHVVALVRDAETATTLFERWGVRGEVRQGDLLTDRLAPLLVDLRPDVVFNLAGYGVDRGERDDALAERTNVGLVHELADALSDAPSAGSWDGARLVHVGSALEYGLERGVLHEEMTVTPHTAYGRTKLAATTTLRDVARATGARFVVARVFTAFGAGEHDTRLLPTLVRAAREGSDVALSSGMQRRDFIAADEVAHGLLRLAVAPLPPGSVVNLATGRLATVRDFAQVAARHLAIAPDRLRFGSEPVRDDEMAPAGVSVERLRSATGWLPSADLESAIRRMIDAGERFAPEPRA